jgi:hypothetical protein
MHGWGGEESDGARPATPRPRLELVAKRLGRQPSLLLPGNQPVGSRVRDCQRKSGAQLVPIRESMLLQLARYTMRLDLSGSDSFGSLGIFSQYICSGAR